MTTATALVGALYIGHSGKGYKGTLVAFEIALMYGLTAGIIVVPTYSHWPENYLVEAPKL